MYQNRLYLMLFLFLINPTQLIAQQKQDDIKPAGVLLVCAQQPNRSAFATDYYGNIGYCINDTCETIMHRPGNAKPVSLSCISDNFAYIYYSNNKLYRCLTVGGCTVQTVVEKKVIPVK